MEENLNARLERLKRFGWNRRILDLDDFYRLCKRERIATRTLDFRLVKGSYMMFDGAPVIFLKASLRESKLTEVAWHEVGHYVYHAPGIQCYGRHRKTETQADYVAACALIPKPLLLSRTTDELIDIFGYPLKLIRTRQEIWRNLQK